MKNKNILVHATLLAAPLLGGCEGKQDSQRVSREREVARSGVDEVLEATDFPPVIIEPVATKESKEANRTQEKSISASAEQQKEAERKETQPLSEEETLDKARGQLRRKAAERGISLVERDQKINEEAWNSSPYGYIDEKEKLQTIDATSTVFGAAELKALTEFGAQKAELLATVMTRALGLVGRNKSQSVLVTLSENGTTATVKLTMSLEWTTQLDVPHDVTVEGSFTKSGLTEVVVKRPGNYPIKNEPDAKTVFQGVFVPSTMVMVKKTVTYRTLVPAEEAAKLAKSKSQPGTSESAEKPEERKIKPPTEAEIKPEMPMTQEVPKNGNSADDAETKPLSEEEILDKEKAKLRLRLAEFGLKFLTTEQKMITDVFDLPMYEYEENQKRLRSFDSLDAPGKFGTSELAALKEFSAKNEKLLTEGIFDAMELHGNGKAKPILVTLSDDGTRIQVSMTMSFYWTLEVNIPHEVTVEGTFTKGTMEKFSIKRPKDYPIKNEEGAKNFLQGVFVPAAVKVTEKRAQFYTLTPVQPRQQSSNLKEKEQE